MWLVLLLQLTALTAALDWYAQPFHVVLTSNVSLFRETDVHLVTLSIADHVGATATAAVHCVNGTVDDYTIDLTLVTLHDRFNETLYSGTLKLGGDALPVNMSDGGTVGVLPQPAVIAAYPEVAPSDPPVVIFVYGPNPPPPPPPPPACETSTTEAACHKVSQAGSCEWCVSVDKVHAECFHADHLPDYKSWHCR